jgi:hypothetical protein
MAKTAGSHEICHGYEESIRRREKPNRAYDGIIEPGYYDKPFSQQSCRTTRSPCEPRACPVPSDSNISGWTPTASSLLAKCESRGPEKVVLESKEFHSQRRPKTLHRNNRRRYTVSESILSSLGRSCIGIFSDVNLLSLPTQRQLI